MAILKVLFRSRNILFSSLDPGGKSQLVCFHLQKRLMVHSVACLDIQWLFLLKEYKYPKIEVLTSWDGIGIWHLEILFLYTRIADILKPIL